MNNCFGFRYLYGVPTDERPPYLTEYNIINGYQIFQSEFNQLVFVIYDKENELYYRLERADNKILKTNINLEQWIKILITKD